MVVKHLSILSVCDIQKAALAFVILLKDLCPEYVSAGTHTALVANSWSTLEYRGW